MSQYNDAFYKAQRHSSLTSAEAIVPELIRLIAPHSVLDVGCGTGVWLSVFEDSGITDYLGLDGDWVNDQVLAIPKIHFRKTDLTAPVDLNRNFDLAISMEVGEHIRAECADIFIDNIVRHAPAVLFSAAIPQQGGTGHINEQWQSWWAQKFSDRGYRAVDCMRQKYWQDQNVRPWYAQNMILYIDEKELQKLPLLADFKNTGPLDAVHPAVYGVNSDVLRKSVGTLAGHLPGAIWRGVKRRIGRG